MTSRSPLGKSSATPGCIRPSESRLRVAHHPAAGDLVTDRPPLTLVLSPCLATARLLGRAGVMRTIGRRVPFRPPNSAYRRSLTAIPFRGVVRRSMWPPDRILVPNTVRAPEQPGEFFFGPLAALVTAAGRLLLACLSRRSTLAAGHMPMDEPGRYPRLARLAARADRKSDSGSRGNGDSGGALQFDQGCSDHLEGD